MTLRRRTFGSAAALLALAACGEAESGEARAPAARADGGLDLAAQASAAQVQEEGFPANTVIARLAVDPDALAGVGMSGELVAALREHLTIDLAMPLAEPLTVFLRGYAGDPAGSAPGFRFGYCTLSLRHPGPETLDDAPYAVALRASHPDDELCMDEDGWDEEAEWKKLLEALEVGLPQSSDTFRPPSEAGRLPLRVAAVHVVDVTDWEFMESLRGARLELQPEPDFASSRNAGWEEPEGFGYDVRALVIMLEPAETGRP